jgi:hypothetical protein
MGKSQEDFANHERVVWEKYAGAAPPKPTTKCSAYINRTTSGMQAKKYKGGIAVKAKASSTRLFEQYFKPLT